MLLLIYRPQYTYALNKRLRKAGAMADKIRGNWWAVVAIYKVVHPGISGRFLGRRLGEKRVLLVDATDEEEARRVGLELAQAYETQYRNPYNDLVCWRLVKVEEVVHLIDQEIGHGSEVYNEWLVSKTRQRKCLSV